MYSNKSCRIVVWAVVLLVGVSLVHGQWITFEETYGGLTNDIGNCIRQTSDGGYIITGYRYRPGNIISDILLMKLYPNGVLDWIRTYGNDKDDFAKCVQITSDGGYIIAGTTFSYAVSDEYPDAVLIKTNSAGDVSWIKTYGGIKGEWGYYVEQTDDGGYIMCGETFSYGVGTPTYPNLYLVKTDASGNEQWHKAYGGTHMDWGWCVRQTSDDGFVIIGNKGYLESDGRGDLYLVKTDENGNTFPYGWERVYGDGPGGVADAGRFVIPYGDPEKYVTIGSTEQGALYPRAWLMELDSDGYVIWDRRYFGYSSSYPTYAECGQRTDDNGYIIAGTWWSTGGTLQDLYFFKTNAIGERLWERNYGGNYHDYGYFTQQTSDGGYVFSGLYTVLGTDAQIYVVKTDPYGNVDSGKDGTDIFERSEIHFINSSITTSTSSRKVSLGITAATAGKVIARVYDKVGRCIRNITCDVNASGNGNVAWDLKDSHGTVVSSGIYFITIETDKGFDIAKVTVIK